MAADVLTYAVPRPDLAVSPVYTARHRMSVASTRLVLRRTARMGPLLVLLAVLGLPARTAGQTAPSDAAGVRELQEAFVTGHYEDVVSRGAGSTDPAVVVLVARARLATGQYDEAEQPLARAAEADPTGPAALEFGLLLRTRGRRAEATRALQSLVSVPAGAGTAALVRAGRAARALGRFDDANARFREAVAAAPGNADAHAAWGELFLEKHNPKEAAQSFRSALAADAASVAGQLGMARALADDNPPAAAQLARQVLARNPRDVDAHLLLADLALDQLRRADAAASVADALRVNPRHPEALARRAAIAWLEGRTADVERDIRDARALDPSFGEAYRVVAAAAARHYRFEEAATLARQAIAVDRDLVRAYADLGLHLMRTGDEAGARRVLELAFRADPYDVLTFNMLGLLDTLEKFETVQDGNLIIRLHPDEAAVMREYVPRLAREAVETLSRRWNLTPAGPILIEMFPRHDDFAVRTAGLPGMVGALGACFGRVVTLDSPRARPPGEFNWAATLWHEIAHVITLQLSAQRVPRWLTEGISVWEETRAHPAWGREMEVTFAGALLAGRVLPLAELNAGFSDPKTISLAYYEASLLVDHLVRRFGEPTLRRLVASYATGVEGDAAIAGALGVEVPELQRSFDAFLAERFAPLRAALVEPDGFSADMPVDALRTLAAAHPGSYPVQMALARALEAVDPAAATAAYERAAALVPTASGESSPLARMAALAVKAGDRSRAARALEALTTHDHTAVEAARQLVTLLDSPTDAARRVTAWQRVAAVDPFDAAAHTALGQAALTGGTGEEAVRYFRIALAGGPQDRAAAHADLAEALVRTGDRNAARREVLAALEVAPTYPRAQELLLQLVEGGR